MDATGSLIRLNKHSPRTIYLYSCIVQISSSYIPLFELISTKHDQVSIGEVLGKFKYCCEGSLGLKLPCVGRIVTDCSFAIIYAIMASWNITTLKRYLTSTYYYCIGKFTSTDINGLVIVRLCKNHWTKMVCNNLSSHSVKGKRKTIIVEAILKLMACCNLSEINSKFTSFITIILTPYRCPNVVDAFKDLDLTEDVTDYKEPEIESICDELAEHNFRSRESYEETPFNQHCRRLVEKFKDSLQKDGQQKAPDNDKDKNPFYCPEFLNEIFFKNHYGAFLPLWTSLLDQVKLGSRPQVASNAPVEGYFRIKKHHVHKQKSRDKPGRYVMLSKNYAEAASKEVRLKLNTRTKPFQDEEEIDPDDPAMKKEERRKDSCASRETTSIDDTTIHVDNTVTETWDNKKRQFRYSEGKTIQRVSNILNLGTEVNAGKHTQLSKSSGRENSRGKGKKSLSLSKKGSETGKSLADVVGPRELWMKKDKGAGPSLSCQMAKVLSSSSRKVRFTDELDVNTDLENVSPSTKKGSHDGPTEELHVGTKQKINDLPHGQSVQKVGEYQASETHPLDVKEDDVIFDIKILSTKDTLKNTHYEYYLPHDENRDPVPLLWSKLTEREQTLLDNAARGDRQRAIVTFGEMDRPLFLANFHQVLDNKPLSTLTIDAVLYEMKNPLSSNEAYVCNSTQSKLILECSTDKALSIITAPERCSLILLPHCETNHWFLCIIDTKSREFFVLNPGDDSLDEKKYHRAVSMYLKNTHGTQTCNMPISVELAKHRRWSFPKQPDDQNCGVYVLRYIRAILEGKTRMNKFDTEKYRIELAKMLLSTMQSCLEQSRTDFDDDLLFRRFDNGLFRSVQYYCTSLEKYTDRPERVVADYGLKLLPITSKNFKDLCRESWIDGSVIDAAINSIMSHELREDYINIRCQHVTQILFQKAGMFLLLDFIDIEDKILIMPTNVENTHWILIIANIRDRVYRSYDPKDLKKTAEYMQEFLRYLEQRHSRSSRKEDRRQWTVDDKPINLPEQAPNDNKNCGPLVILYVFIILNNYKYEGSIAKFRRNLAYKILQDSPSMRHLCGYCGKDEFPTEGFIRRYGTETLEMVQCEQCRRWIHHQCDLLIKTEPYQNICNDSYKYTCEMCLAYKERPENAR